VIAKQEFLIYQEEPCQAFRHVQIDVACRHVFSSTSTLLTASIHPLVFLAAKLGMSPWHCTVQRAFACHFWQLSGMFEMMPLHAFFFCDNYFCLLEPKLLFLVLSGLHQCAHPGNTHIQNASHIVDPFLTILCSTENCWKSKSFQEQQVRRPSLTFLLRLALSSRYLQTLEGSGTRRG